MKSLGRRGIIILVVLGGFAVFGLFSLVNGHMPGSSIVSKATGSGLLVAPLPGVLKPTLVQGVGPLSIKSLTSLSLGESPLPYPLNTSPWATINNGVITVAGNVITHSTGAIDWTKDGNAIVYTSAPPVTSPNTNEPVFSLTSGGTSVQLATTNDPWRMSVSGNMAAFNNVGTLALANTETNQVLPTNIQLGTGAYPSQDSDFSLSPDNKYVAVLSPSDQITMYHLTFSGSGSNLTVQTDSVATLPGLVANDRNSWGSWSPNSSEFLYATQDSQQLPGLQVWSVASQHAQSVSNFATSNMQQDRGRYLVIGWLPQLPENFVVEQVGTTGLFSGTYLLGNTSGTVKQVLWKYGAGGQVSPSGDSILFAGQSTAGSPPTTWVAKF